MKIFDKIVYETLTKNIVSRQSLLSLSRNGESVNKQLRMGVENGYLKPLNLKFKRGSRANGVKQETYHCFMLTPLGMAYAKRKASKNIPWLKEISYKGDKKFSPYGKVPNEAALKRYMSLSAASVMMDIAGADEHLLFYDASHADGKTQDGQEDSVDISGEKDRNILVADDDYFDLDTLLFGESDVVEEEYYDDASDSGTSLQSRKWRSQSSLVLDGWSTTRFMRQQQEVLDGEIIYKDSLLLKHEFSDIRENANIKDLSGCRFAGYVESQRRNALVYVSSELNPTSFPRHIVVKELSFLTQIQTTIAKFKHSREEVENLILVPSIKSFQQTYYMKELVEKKSFEEIFETKNAAVGRSKIDDRRMLACGERFTDTWVVPQTCDGVYEIRDLMLLDIVGEAEILAKRIPEENDDMYVNTGENADEFSLVDSYGNYYTIGVHMNVQQMKRVDAVALQNPETSYYILCQRWQVPYYESVLRAAMPYAVDDIVPFADKASTKEKIKMACEINGADAKAYAS